MFKVFLSVWTIGQPVHENHQHISDENKNIYEELKFNELPAVPFLHPYFQNHLKSYPFVIISAQLSMHSNWTSYCGKHFWLFTKTSGTVAVFGKHFEIHTSHAG